VPIKINFSKERKLIGYHLKNLFEFISI